MCKQIEIKNAKDTNEYTGAIEEILTLAKENGLDITLYLEDSYLWIDEDGGDDNSSYIDLSEYRGEW